MADTSSLAMEVESFVYENDTIGISKIDSVSFLSLKKKFERKVDTLEYTEDITEAMKILKGRVIFAGYNEDTYKLDSSIVGEMIYEIRFNNGKKLNVIEQENYGDLGFYRYYPTLDILLCEGGHSSDFSFDLKNGLIGPEVVGNPAYILKSPTNKYQLNGWFPGQECSSYFIQTINETGNKLVAELPLSISKEGFDLCTISDIFWVDDQTLYFRNFYYENTSDLRLGYFKLIIK